MARKNGSGIEFSNGTSQSTARTALAEFDNTSTNTSATAQQAMATHHNIIGTPPNGTRTHTLPDVVYAITIYNDTLQTVTIKRASTAGIPLASKATANFTYNGS